MPSADSPADFAARRAPSPLSSDDSHNEVIDAIRTVLDQVGRFTFRRIDVSLEEGRVVLRGSVKTWFQKQLAQHVTMQVPGVSQVVNELVVDPNRSIGTVF